MAKNDSLKTSEDTEEISKPNNIFVKLYKKFEKEIKFVLTGGLNTVFDFVIFNVLKSVLGANATISNIVSTSICIVISFYLNSKYV